MSHLTKIKTALNDAGKLERGMKFLGLEFAKNRKINSYNKVGVSEYVITNAGHWNVGFQKDQSGVYEVIADSFAWNEMAQKPKLKNALSKARGDARKQAFIGLLQQACAVTTAIVEATKLGQTIVVSEPDENGIIHAHVEESVFA